MSISFLNEGSLGNNIYAPTNFLASIFFFHNIYSPRHSNFDIHIVSLFLYNDIPLCLSQLYDFIQ